MRPVKLFITAGEIVFCNPDKKVGKQSSLDKFEALRARTLEWKEAPERVLCEKFPWGVRGLGVSLVSDNRSQPTSMTFIRDTVELDIQQIFCSYDNPRGNAETEWVMRTIKEEFLRLNDFISFE